MEVPWSNLTWIHWIHFCCFCGFFCQGPNWPTWTWPMSPGHLWLSASQDPSHPTLWPLRKIFGFNQVTFEEDPIARNRTKWSPGAHPGTQSILRMLRWLRWPSSPRRGFRMGRMLSLAEKLGHLAALRSLRSLGRWDWEHSQAAPAFGWGLLPGPVHFHPSSVFPGALRARAALHPRRVDRFQWCLWSSKCQVNCLALVEAFQLAGKLEERATTATCNCSTWTVAEQHLWVLWQYLLRYCGRSPTQLPSSLSSLLSFFQQYWEHLHLQNPAQKNHHQPATWVYQLLYPHHIPIINSINLVLIYEMLGSRSYHHYHLHKCI